jgi:universal stress protein A
MKFKPGETCGDVVVEVHKRDSRLMDAMAGSISAKPTPVSFERILVPVDFSAGSRQALAYAQPFAQQLGATIYLLNVVELDSSALSSDNAKGAPLEGHLAQYTRGQLRELVREVLGPEIPTELLVRAGRPHEEIVAAAESLGIDLIILSTHGRTGLEHALLGSTAERVVRYAPCPVFVVRQRNARPQRIHEQTPFTLR